jgi:hypothetical protein
LKMDVQASLFVTNEVNHSRALKHARTRHHFYSGFILHSASPRPFSFHFSIIIIGVVGVVVVGVAAAFPFVVFSLSCRCHVTAEINNRILNISMALSCLCSAAE